MPTINEGIMLHVIEMVYLRHGCSPQRHNTSSYPRHGLPYTVLERTPRCILFVKIGADFRIEMDVNSRICDKRARREGSSLPSPAGMARPLMLFLNTARSRLKRIEFRKHMSIIGNQHPKHLAGLRRADSATAH